MLWKYSRRMFLLVAVGGLCLGVSRLMFAQSSNEGRPTAARAEARTEPRVKSRSEALSEALTKPRTDSRSEAERPNEEIATEIEAFTEPYRDVAIAAAEMGTIASVSVKEGDLVTGGTVVASLDDQVLRAGLEVARGSSQATGTLKSATADLEMKATEIRKLQELRERDHASQREVDRTTLEHQIAAARVQAVREELQIKSLECARIGAQLEQRLIRSPIDGVITEVLKDSGEFVSPSDPVVVRVVQLDPLLVVFSVPLTLRKSVVQDQTVRLKLDSSATAAEGVVEYVSPTADASNTSVRVKVRLPNPNGQWQAGERAVLLIDANSADDSGDSAPLAKQESATRRSR